MITPGLLAGLLIGLAWPEEGRSGGHTIQGRYQVWCQFILLERAGNTEVGYNTLQQCFCYALHFKLVLFCSILLCINR